MGFVHVTLMCGTCYTGIAIKRIYGDEFIFLLSDKEQHAFLLSDKEIFYLITILIDKCIKTCTHHYTCICTTLPTHKDVCMQVYICAHKHTHITRHTDTRTCMHRQSYKFIIN